MMPITPSGTRTRWILQAVRPLPFGDHARRSGSASAAICSQAGAPSPRRACRRAAGGRAWRAPRPARLAGRHVPRIRGEDRRPRRAQRLGRGRERRVASAPWPRQRQRLRGRRHGRRARSALHHAAALIVGCFMRQLMRSTRSSRWIDFVAPADSPAAPRCSLLRRPLMRCGVGARVGRQPARDLAPCRHRARPPRRRARSGPRPRTTPAGSRLLAASRSARAAPSSTRSSPAGFSVAGDPLLARRDRRGARQNQVQRAPASMRRSGCGCAARRRCTCGSPAATAMRAAAILVAMPPRADVRGRAAAPSPRSRGVMPRHLGDELRRRVARADRPSRARPRPTAAPGSRR